MVPLFAALLLATAPNGSAQIDSLGELRGRITDAGSALPVVAATIRIEGTRLGALADDSGRYVVAAIPA